MVKVSLGSVSSGTMRPEHLIPAFMDALEDIREALAAPGATTEDANDNAYRVSAVSRIDDLLGAIEQRLTADDDASDEWNGAAYYDSDDAHYDLEALCDMLSELAPPYCYFGASEGDGSDYGFWIAYESVEEDCANGDLIRLPAGADWPEDEIRERAESGCPASGVVYITDHGNMSLWAAEQTQPAEPIWDVV